MAEAWSGIIATILCAAVGFGVKLAKKDLASDNFIGAAMFVIVGLAVTVGGEWLQRTRRRAVGINRGLAQREAHLRSILETIPEAMIVIDGVRELVELATPLPNRQPIDTI